MPPVGANITPALPLSHHVPPSPRSDASGTTDQSRGESEKSVDRITSQMSRISLPPRVPLDLPWKSDPSREFPKRRSWHKRHSARLGGQTQSSHPPSSSNTSTVGLSDIPPPARSSTAPNSPQAVVMPVLPRQQPHTKPSSTPLQTSPTSTKSPPPPTLKPAPKSWSALVSQNAKPNPPNRTSFVNNKLPEGKMVGLAAALASFDPFSTVSTISPVIRPRGLINTGNLCFMNVVLQALLYCPPFYNLLDTIRRHVVHKIASQTPLLDALIDFLREFEIVDPTSKEINPNGPVVGQEHIKDFGDPFIPERVYNGWKGNRDFEMMKRGNQEDAEEFLGLLLNAVHDEFLNAFKSLPAESQRLLNNHYEVQIRNGIADTEDVHIRVNSVNSEDGWKEIGPGHKVSTTRTQSIVESPITRIFTGNLRSVLRKPGHKDSITLEPYRPLQLDIQDLHIRSVTDALKHITATETIIPDFDGTGRAMTRRSFIEKLPPILILHLKRFIYDKHGTKKVWKKIAYPLNLEIPLDVLSPTQRSESPPQFQLFGVIYHHGTSATGGHYTADVLLQDGHTWLNLDDTKLKWIDAGNVAVSEKDGNWGEVDHHNGHDGVGWDNIKSKVAYILLYKRIHL